MQIFRRNYKLKFQINILLYILPKKPTNIKIKTYEK